jgi:hypothetical protein
MNNYLDNRFPSKYQSIGVLVEDHSIPSTLHYNNAFAQLILDIAQCSFFSLKYLD